MHQGGSGRSNQEYSIKTLYHSLRIHSHEGLPQLKYPRNVFQPINLLLLHMSPTQESQTSDNRGVVTNPGGLQTRFTVGSRDPVYHAKAKILYDALQEIDMGKFQVSLSIVCLLS